MTPIVEGIHVTRHFTVGGPWGKRREVTALDDVSIAITPGTSVGLAGESGSGKSTLARILSLLTPPTTGAVRFRGEEISIRDRTVMAEFRRTVQMVFQDPASSLNPRRRVREILMEPLFIHRIGDRHAREERVRELAAGVGLSDDDLFRYPHEFSGGQRQRIVIARALATGPELLIADEPLSALDLSIQAQIINLLNELKRRHRLTLLVISHDLTALPHLVDTIAVMNEGRIVETGPAREIVDSPRHPYTKRLTAAIPQLPPAVPTHQN